MSDPTHRKGYSRFELLIAMVTEIGVRPAQCANNRLARGVMRARSSCRASRESRHSFARDIGGLNHLAISVGLNFFKSDKRRMEISMYPDNDRGVLPQCSVGPTA